MTAFFFSHWPQTLDPGVIARPSAEWTAYLAYVTAMAALGVTHTALWCWDPGLLGLADFNNKVADIRALGVNICPMAQHGYIETAGAWDLDGGLHANLLDLRFFDSPGLGPCARDVALDPSYVGWVWTDYTTLLGTMCTDFGLTNDDAVFYDLEYWIPPAIWRDTWCDPYMVADSTRCGENPTANPLHNAQIAFDNYISHWLDRGQDMTAAVHGVAAGALVFHYAESSAHGWLERSEHVNPCNWPPGAGDCASPSLFRMNDLTAFKTKLYEGSDWTDAIAHIGFSYGAAGWMALPDTTAAKTVGKLLAAAGFRGAMEYPGWSIASYNSIVAGGVVAHADYAAFVTYWQAQTAAFMEGWAEGMVWRYKARSDIPAGVGNKGWKQFTLTPVAGYPGVAHVRAGITFGTVGTEFTGTLSVTAPSTGTYASMTGDELKELRRYFRRGGQSFSVRVYDVSTDAVPTLPRDGEYFPGEIDGARIVPGGVSVAPSRDKQGGTRVRITLIAAVPACEAYVVIMSGGVAPTSDCRGFYSPDGKSQDGNPVYRRLDGKYKLYWVTVDTWWRIEEVATPGNYVKRVDPDPTGAYVAGGGDGDQPVTIEALEMGAEETFGLEFRL